MGTVDDGRWCCRGAGVVQVKLTQVGERPLSEIHRYITDRDPDARPQDAIGALDVVLKEVRPLSSTSVESGWDIGEGSHVLIYPLVTQGSLMPRCHCHVDAGGLSSLQGDRPLSLLLRA